MRIGQQLYGFQGFEVTRPSSAATTNSATPDTASSTADAVKNLSRLKELVTDLRRLAAKPVTNTSEEVTYAQQEADVQRNVEYLTISEPQSYEVSRTTIRGANSAQISDLQLSKFDGTDPYTLTGDVTTAAATAELTIAGDQTGHATEDASYTLTTEHGVFQIQFTGGEDLADVAARITDQHETTGVNATVEGTNLVLRSDTIGSAAQIILERNEVSPTIVSGRNSQQISSLSVLNQTPGTSDTLTGSVVSQAAVAELVYQGASNQTIAGSSAFRLTGNAGSVLVSVTKGESLAAVTNRLNQQSGSTGVVVTQDNNTLRFKSVDKGSTESVRIDQVVKAETITSSGRNAAQVPTFAINSLTRGAEEFLSGQVLTTAGKASLTLQGSGTGTVVSTATFEVRGNLGTTNISITKDETLAAVVTRINNLTNTTGVTSRVQSNQIIFESSTLGSAAEVQVNLQSLPYTVAATGRNAAQLSSFNVQSFTNGASQTFTGSVTQAAAVAEFSFKGSSSFLVNKNSTFTLTGAQGSRQFTTTTTQTLANLASQVNAQTTNTGVTATVSGRDIYFRSVAVGSAAQVRLQVNSGSFSITGADANGSAYGVDAKATINSVVRTGVGNNFSFTDAKGSYTFTTVQGYTGSLSTITVTSTAGTFTLTGGNGSGTALGTDATATINGQQLTGTANNFNVTTSKGQFTLGFAAGFTSSFSSITAKSTLDDFSFSGGDQSGTATGVDFVANINGAAYRSLSNTVTHTTANGSYELNFDTSFVGQFAPITISTSAGPQITGGDGQGHSTGVDAVAELNGRQITALGNKFQYDDAQVGLSFNIAAGFTGQIDPLTIDTTTEVVQEYVTRVIENPATAFTPRKASAPRVSTQVSQQTSILQEIEELASQPTAGQGDTSATNSPSAAESEKTTKAQVVGAASQRLAQNSRIISTPLIHDLLNTNVTLLKNTLDVKG